MKALALMPFSDTFNDVFESMCAACKNDASAELHNLNGDSQNEGVSHLECTRVDKENGDIDIIKLLLDSIRTASFCIADLTGNNKNVLWELGYAMALTKPVIIITQDRDSTGFDLRNLRSLKYDRTALKETLEIPLSKTIKAMLSAPDAFACPTDPLHAQALAMSIASPTYFLGPDFKIKYMNEAAADMFVSDSGQGAAFWHGRTLRDFINSLDSRLVNFPAIEKNLQIQKEQIRQLEQEGRESAICPYNIEQVVLSTNDYGTIELQKTGVAVRDPIDESIKGWVVSFNVVNAHDPTKFALFHENHGKLIAGRLFPTDEAKGRIAAKRKPKPKDSGEQDMIARWQANPEPAPEIRPALGYAEKEVCFEFSARIMKSDQKRYGLSSVRWIPEWFFDYGHSEFLMMTVPGTTTLCGVFRLSLDHDLRQYPKLDGAVAQFIKDDKTFADAGAYFDPAITATNRPRHLATFFGHAVAVCAKRSQDIIYAQVPKPTLKFFITYGWKRVGPDFECPGWDQRWVPVVVQPDLYRDLESPIEAPLNKEFVQRTREAFRQCRAAYEFGP
jgi:hypothetical protein